MYPNDLRIPNQDAFVAEEVVTRLKSRNPYVKAESADPFYRVDMADVFRHGTHVLFTTPAAYSPHCSALHLPGYVRDAAKFKAVGVDAIWCMSVNDPFVMQRWVQAADPTGENVLWISDSSADVSRSLHLAICMAGLGLGTRARRAALLIKDGRILHVSLEPPAEFYISSSEYMLKVVKAYLT